MESSKEQIIKYFFNEHLKVKDIAERMNVSSSYVTQLLSKIKDIPKKKNIDTINQKKKEN